MIIRCKKTKRFLCEINIEEYLKHLQTLGIKHELPLKVVIPCKNCRESEEYDVYEKHYIFILCYINTRNFGVQMCW